MKKYTVKNSRDIRILRISNLKVITILYIEYYRIVCLFPSTRGYYIYSIQVYYIAQLYRYLFEKQGEVLGSERQPRVYYRNNPNYKKIEKHNNRVELFSISPGK
jgi:hypothetical protein